MRMAVTTPTGNVGRHVVAMLVRAGIRPRLLARDPAAVVAASAGVDALCDHCQRTARVWPPGASASPTT